MLPSVQITKSSRLILRTWELADASSAYKFYGDPEVSKFIGDGQPIQSLERVEAVLKKFNVHQDHFGFSPWAVVDAISTQVIGICGLHTYNDAKEPELGFRFLRSHWGQGLGTEASRLSLIYGFKELSLPCISALTQPQNLATQKVLVKSGFSLIGNTNVDGRVLLRFECRMSAIT